MYFSKQELVLCACVAVVKRRPVLYQSADYFCFVCFLWDYWTNVGNTESGSAEADARHHENIPI